MTAKVSEEDRVKGLEAGADAYLTKPFSSEELTAIVDRLLDRNDCIRRRLTGSAQGSGSQGSLGTQVAQDQNVTETPHGLQDEDNEISLADAAGFVRMRRRFFWTRLNSNPASFLKSRICPRGRWRTAFA